MELVQLFGDFVLYFNFDSCFYYEDVLCNVSCIDVIFVCIVMVCYDFGLVLLDCVGGSDVVFLFDFGVLLQCLCGVFVSVLCDVGGCLLWQLLLLLLDQVDEIWLVIDVLIVMLVLLDQVLKYFVGQCECEKCLQLVINCYDDSSGMSLEQIVCCFEVLLLVILFE